MAAGVGPGSDESSSAPSATGWSHFVQDREGAEREIVGAPADVRRFRWLERGVPAEV